MPDDSKAGRTAMGMGIETSAGRRERDPDFTLCPGWVTVTQPHHSANPASTAQAKINSPLPLWSDKRRAAQLANRPHKNVLWASLMSQWQRTHLPTQETQVHSLGQEASLRRKWQSAPYCCLENPMGRRGYGLQSIESQKSQTRLSK